MDSYDEEEEAQEETSWRTNCGSRVEVVTVTKMDVIQRQLEDLKVPDSSLPLSLGSNGYDPQGSGAEERADRRL